MKTISKYFFVMLAFTITAHAADREKAYAFVQISCQGDIEQAKELLEDGLDPNQQYPIGDPLLWRAIVESPKPTAMTNLLLQYQANPNATRQCGTMLSEACSAPREHAEIVHLLLNARADVNARSSQGRTAIRDAVRSNIILPSAACFHRLLNEPNIELDHPKWKEKPACTLATRISFNASHLPVFARMLALGADPNGKNMNGRTILNCYSKPNWHGAFEDEILDPRLRKSVLLILDEHRNNAKVALKNLNTAILNGSSLAADVVGLIAQFTCPLIAPDDKELDDALELYKNVKPIASAEAGDRKES